MSKKWTEASPENEAIVDYKEFNAGFNAYKSSFNGDLDRTTLPDDFIGETSVVAGAFHQVQITNSSDPTINADTTLDPNSGWRCPSYETYNGGWVQIDEVTVSKFKEGMCHWEYSFIFFNYIVQSFLGATKYIEVRMVWDDTVVLESYKISQPIQSTRLVASFPTTGGSHTAKVFIRAAPRGDATYDSLTYGIFHVVCPSHLFIGRWR
tara:strand:+ start:1419 stop:2042 length:624 start_codon:yes stop_codon:yes gene_type:complete